jgi:hypothetical protein
MEPAISIQGTTDQDFVPTGWKKVESIQNDFNADGLNDIVLTIAETDPKNIIKNECGLGEKVFDSNPYAIIFILKQKNGTYKLAATDFKLIPRRDDPVLDQPYQLIEVDNNVLKVSYYYWQSAGSWTTSTYTYLFKYIKGCMRLIGSEYFSIHRSSLEEHTTNINFAENEGVATNYNPDTALSKETKFKPRNIQLDCLGVLPADLEEYITNSSTP